MAQNRVTIPIDIQLSQYRAQIVNLEKAFSNIKVGDNIRRSFNATIKTLEREIGQLQRRVSSGVHSQYDLNSTEDTLAAIVQNFASLQRLTNEISFNSLMLPDDAIQRFKKLDQAVDKAKNNLKSLHQIKFNELRGAKGFAETVGQLTGMSRDAIGRSSEKQLMYQLRQIEKDTQRQIDTVQQSRAKLQAVRRTTGIITPDVAGATARHTTAQEEQTNAQTRRDAISAELQQLREAYEEKQKIYEALVSPTATYRNNGTLSKKENQQLASMLETQSQLVEQSITTAQRLNAVKNNWEAIAQAVKNTTAAVQQNNSVMAQTPSQTNDGTANAILNVLAANGSMQKPNMFFAGRSLNTLIRGSNEVSQFVGHQKSNSTLGSIQTSNSEIYNAIINSEISKIKGFTNQTTFDEINKAMREASTVINAVIAEWRKDGITLSEAVATVRKNLEPASTQPTKNSEIAIAESSAELSAVENPMRLIADKVKSQTKQLSTIDPIQALKDELIKSLTADLNLQTTKKGILTADSRKTINDALSTYSVNLGTLTNTKPQTYIDSITKLINDGQGIFGEIFNNPQFIGKIFGLNETAIDKIVQQASQVYETAASQVSKQETTKNTIETQADSREQQITQAKKEADDAKKALDQRQSILNEQLTAQQAKIKATQEAASVAEHELEQHQEVADALSDYNGKVAQAGDSTEKLSKAQQAMTQITNVVTAKDEEVAKAEVKRTQQERNQQRNQYVRNIVGGIRTTVGQANIGVGSANNINNKNVDIARGAYEISEQQRNASNAVRMYTDRLVGSYAIFNKVTQAIRSAWQEIKTLDKAITGIAVVTNKTSAELWNSIGAYTAIAKEYGVTTEGVYQVSQLYYQMGLSENQVTSLTTETLKMAKIAGLDYATATDYMASALNGFKMEASEANTIVDTYSALAATAATTTKELAKAMSKTASIAEASGMSVQSTSAMLTMMIETTRESPENLGTALKSMIARFQKINKDPVSLVDVDGETTSFNEVDSALRTVGISLTDTTGQMRNLDDVIFELAAKWDTLDRNTQKWIANAAAGSRRICCPLHLRALY